MKIREVDVAIIGQGTAGTQAYKAALRHTKNVVVIQDGPYGTTCARSGCMPSKLLIAAADAANAMDEAPTFGVYPGDKKIFGKQVMQRVRDMRDYFVAGVVKGVDKMPPEHQIRGKAVFVDNNTLQIGDDLQIKAKAIVIAVGSRPRRIPQDKELGDRSIVNDDVFEWEKLPEAIAVFGTGVIGMELGQALQRLGVKTTVFGRSGKVAAFTDPELQDEAEKIFHTELEVFPGAEVHEMIREGDKVLIKFTSMKGVEYKEEFDYTLSSIGRIPNTDTLGLENTTLELDKRGMPQFDTETLRCGTSNIFITGDANNHLPLQHEAAIEGTIAGENAALFPKVKPGHRRAMLGVVFTDPEMAMVGKLYRELPENSFVIGKVRFADQGRSRVLAKTKGILHLYADKKSGKLLGAEMLGPHAEHLAHLIAWGIEFNATTKQLLEMPFYHPTIEEGLRSALRDADSQLEQ